ncbi:hypothetical protein M1567_02475 [Candidatus Marsarchaeota archaeon]|nr:hypothetical protein [Candidatus Marsarchaeota archaeon]
MQDSVNEIKSQHAKAEFSVKVMPAQMNKARDIFYKITEREEFADIRSGIFYSLSLEKGDKAANMKIKSLFKYPSEENARRMADLIEEIANRIQKEAGNSLEPILRQ